MSMLYLPINKCAARKRSVEKCCVKSGSTSVSYRSIRVFVAQESGLDTKSIGIVVLMHDKDC